MTSTRSLKSELESYTLRFDGVVEIAPEKLVQFLFLGVPCAKLRVKGNSPEIEEFNRQVSEEDQIGAAYDEPITLDMEWQVPEPYRSLDIEQYISEKFFERNISKDYTEDQRQKALDRIAIELNEVTLREMIEFMRTVIYILETLREKDIVWGVGRGSSCASYLLFIIGLHAVDCVKFDVPMAEFFHE